MVMVLPIKARRTRYVAHHVESCQACICLHSLPKVGPLCAQAYNIAAIWELPTIFVIENNHFGANLKHLRPGSLIVLGYTSLGRQQ